MTTHVEGKSIIITGAGGGFGRLIAQKAAALGANITASDIDEVTLEDTVQSVSEAGGNIQGQVADVTSIDDLKAVAKAAVDAYDRVDVMVNNAGVMPLAFYSDHEAALDKWHRCIDINIKGVLNGTVAVYDQMMAQQGGHVINIASIYGNFPVTGAAVYGATKSAVNFLSESLRVETAGKIKVTVIKPTGVPMTGLSAGVVNPEAVTGILGQNTVKFFEFMAKVGEGETQMAELDQNAYAYAMLDPAHIADGVIHAINQPHGVSIGDMTIRASGDDYIL